MALLFGINQSCNTEDQAFEPQSSIETVAKSDAISFVRNLNHSPKTTAKISGEQNQFEFDKVTQEKLTNTSELLTVIPMKTKAHNQRRRALFLRVGTQIESMIYHEFSDDSFTHNTFSGIVLMTRLNGDFIRAYRLKNNEYVIDLVPSKKPKFGQKTALRTNESVEPIELDEVVVYNRFKVSPGFVSLTNLANEVPISINWDPNYNGGGGSSGGAIVGPVEEDVKIINELTNPCAKKIFTDLQNGLYTENPLKPEVLIPSDGIDLNFSQEILKLFDNSRNTDLTIRNDLLTSGANASTVGATITINNSYLANATQLSVARTIIHETVHAYINALYSNFTQFNSYSFREKIEKYAEDSGLQIGTDDFHHNFMVQYIDAMGYSLYEWDKKFGTGGNLGWEYYKSMAFSGMFQTDPNGTIVAEIDTFKEIVPNANDRQAIANIIINEQNGNNQSKGTKCD